MELGKAVCAYQMQGLVLHLSLQCGRLTELHEVGFLAYEDHLLVMIGVHLCISLISVHDMNANGSIALLSRLHEHTA
jgi:hypothetical protein